MKLPPGATGFASPPSNASPEADQRTFLTICHQAARQTSGTVTSTTPAGATPNFHTVLIAYPDGQIAVLRHTRLPLIALAEPRSPGQTDLTFIDRPDLSAAITQASDLPVMTTAQLDTPLSKADLTDLGSAEHHQIRYWNPDTIGAVLYNYWD